MLLCVHVVRFQAHVQVGDKKETTTYHLQVSPYWHVFHVPGSQGLHFTLLIWNPVYESIVV